MLGWPLEELRYLLCMSVGVNSGYWGAAVNDVKVGLESSFYS